MPLARFDGSHHYPGCEASSGCDCSAAMARQWDPATRDRRLVDAMCAVADGQAPVMSDGAPLVPMGEMPTEKRRTLTDAELLAELEQHAEAGL